MVVQRVKVLLTGGSGDLGSVLAAQLFERGDAPISLDLREPANPDVQFIQGSILDRELLESAISGVDCVVHIAAWHGIHEFKKEKDEYDFWDLNVSGTFMLLETCARAKVSKFVFISSTSVDDWPGIYAHSKILAEDLMRTYVARHRMQIITLRPRAFIPHWNKSVYANFGQWAEWFWKGAVHINDVSDAVVKAIDALPTIGAEHLKLTIDGKCEFSPQELEDWNESSFRNRFGEHSHQLFQKFGLNPANKPRILGYADAERIIGYEPTYGVAELLDDLSRHEHDLVQNT